MSSRLRRSIGRLLVGAAFWALSGVASAAGRTVMLTSLDGTPLEGTLYEAASRPSPGVVLVHMLHRSRGDWETVANRLASGGITALAIDLRGHGGSGGSAEPLTAMADDVRAAVQWLSARPDARPDAIGLAGASLGANLALIVAADLSTVRAVAVLSPSLDYRGVRAGPDLLRRIGDRPVWMAASTDDPFALRTLKDLIAAGSGSRDQYLSLSVGHGTNLLSADGAAAGALVDWLRQRLLF